MIKKREERLNLWCLIRHRRGDPKPSRLRGHTPPPPPHDSLTKSMSHSPSALLSTLTTTAKPPKTTSNLFHQTQSIKKSTKLKLETLGGLGFCFMTHAAGDDRGSPHCHRRPSSHK